MLKLFSKLGVDAGCAQKLVHNKQIEVEDCLYVLGTSMWYAVYTVEFASRRVVEVLLQQTPPDKQPLVTFSYTDV